MNKDDNEPVPLFTFMINAFHPHHQRLMKDYGLKEGDLIGVNVPQLPGYYNNDDDDDDNDDDDDKMPSVVEITYTGKKELTLKEKIMKALEEVGTLSSLDTLQIAKKVIGQHGTQKEVNPTLYELLKEGSITKVHMKNTQRPHWRLNSTTSSSK